MIEPKDILAFWFRPGIDTDEAAHQRQFQFARFGRRPHRNALLGRDSTEEERAYIATGDFVHRRSFNG